MSVKRIILAPLFVALVPLVGCSGAGSEVVGKVTFEGKPLTGGKVTFFHPHRPGRNVSAYVQPDGTYRVLAVPSGEVRVTVVALPPRSKDRQGKKAKGRSHVPPVPLKYTDPETTDLVCRVTSGKETFDIELKP